MNIINISKTVLIAFFAIHLINFQLFAAKKQERMTEKRMLEIIAEEKQKCTVEKIKIGAIAAVITVTSLIAMQLNNTSAIMVCEDSRLSKIQGHYSVIPRSFIVYLAEKTGRDPKGFDKNSFLNLPIAEIVQEKNKINRAFIVLNSALEESKQEKVSYLEFLQVVDKNYLEINKKLGLTKK